MTMTDHNPAAMRALAYFMSPALLAACGCGSEGLVSDRAARCEAIGTRLSAPGTRRSVVAAPARPWHVRDIPASSLFEVLTQSTSATTDLLGQRDHEMAGPGLVIAGWGGVRHARGVCRGKPVRAHGEQEAAGGQWVLRRLLACGSLSTGGAAWGLAGPGSQEQK